MIAKNNLFNIRYNHISKWKGLVGSNKGFCVFLARKYSIRAAAIIIFRTYRKRGFVSVGQIISAFAPPSENDTTSYVDFVSKKLSLFPWDEVPAIKRPDLLYWISYYEVGFEHASLEDICFVLEELYSLKEISRYDVE